MSRVERRSKTHTGRLKAVLASYPALHSLLSNAKATGLRLLGKDARDVYQERAGRIEAIERDVQRIQDRCRETLPRPILFFNASSHPPMYVSLNATAGLVATWSLRVAGQPVVYLVCQKGMAKCLMGTNRSDLDAPPPCTTCVAQTNLSYPAQHTMIFPPRVDGNSPLETELASLSLQDLGNYSYGQLPIGELCLPSVRRILCRHNLDTTDRGRPILSAYIASAIGLAQEMERLLDTLRPRALVVFNGTFFPEATARAVALKSGVPVVSYEGGFLPHSVFFSHDVATEFRIEIPASFQMGATENAQLDDYLFQRFQGNFTMIGIRFWPEMKSISRALRRRMEAYRQVVTVFPNIVFDTSQVYANIVFDNMFHWLDETMQLAAAHPDSLFVVRAHPDEARAGWESQEPVEQWLETRGYLGLPNLVFIPPTEYVSSYELVRLSQFSIVYNSTIGLEATLLGVPVVAGGLTRYSQERVTHAPASPEDYRSLVTAFLEGGPPPLAVDWQQRARRYMYYSLFRAALDMSPFVEPITPSSYTVRPVQAQALHPDQSKEMRVIYDGIVHGKPFHYT